MNIVGKNMDSLLRGKSLNFSIDEISYNAERNLFSVRIIPDIKSRYFLPFHLRFINVSPELVSEGILQRYSNYGFKFDLTDNSHRNSVIQGGYYKLDKDKLDKASISSKIWDNRIL